MEMCILSVENLGITRSVLRANWNLRKMFPENCPKCDTFYAAFVRIANLEHIVFVDYNKNEKNTPKTVDI